MPKTIVQSAYHLDKQQETNWPRKPLLIGCSGGGGHNSAILGLYHHLQTIDPSRTQLQTYDPLLPYNRTYSNLREHIARGVAIMHTSYIGLPIQWVLSSVTPYPVLPNPQELKTEVNALTKTDQRVYIDMLLDVYPAGYESAAIWNSLQKKDKVEDLKKLIALQEQSDKENYQIVFDYFFKQLKQAARKGMPYTELVSTQAMALPALCDVVNYYNIWLVYKQVNAPQLMLHQYMTDLPTTGAVHFFNPLARLKPMQQSQMKLYATGMNAEILQTMFETHNFAQVCDIPPNLNPMVRPAFKEAQYDNSSKFTVDLMLALQGIEPVLIAANEAIAAIMLGSQGSNDTVLYLDPLLQNGMNKVFVFGGTNEAIQKGIAGYLKKHPQYANRIIPLGNQNDRAISSLMTRCNALVIRGGGLSVMEQMAMNHHPKQTLFIHHAEPPVGHPLTSGIPWEDANVEALIHYLKEKRVFCLKTSSERVSRQLEQMRQIYEDNPQVTGEYKEEMERLITNYFVLKSPRFFHHQGLQKVLQSEADSYVYLETIPLEPAQEHLDFIVEDMVCPSP